MKIKMERMSRAIVLSLVLLTVLVNGQNTTVNDTAPVSPDVSTEEQTPPEECLGKSEPIGGLYGNGIVQSDFSFINS